MQELSVSDAFPPADLDAWRAVVTRDLKGKPFETLISSGSGLDVRPLYTEADAPAKERQTFGATAGWVVASAATNPDPAAASREAAYDLARGVQGIDVIHDGINGPRLETADDVNAFLGPIDVEAVDLRLRSGVAFERVSVLLAEHWGGRQCDPTKIRASLGADPIGTVARAGGGVVDAELAFLAGSLPGLERFPFVRAVTIEGPYHDAGATDVEDLGLTLAAAVETLRRLVDAGLDLDATCNQFSLGFCLGRDVYASIAKLRAARLLWARVVEASGGGNASRAIPIYARSADRMATRRDPWVNVLRGTLAAFAAAVGGADRVTIASFDAALGVPGKLGRRLARNTPLILRDEAHLARVADPAGGSYFFERLTQDMAEAAWGVFQQVEAQGGMIQALSNGWVRERVDLSHNARASRVAKRRVAVTGVSEFPHLDEAPVETAPRSGTPPPEEPALFAPFALRRLAAPFEALRDRAEAHAAPRVFLACMGPLAEHTARSTWMSNLLAAGGIRAEVSDGFPSVADAVAAFRASGASEAAICSSDARYAEDLPTLVPALRDAGASRILLAGRPSEASAGVDTFVHLGVNVLAILESLWGAGA